MFKNNNLAMSVYWQQIFNERGKGPWEKRQSSFKHFKPGYFWYYQA